MTKLTPRERAALVKDISLYDQQAADMREEIRRQATMTMKLLRRCVAAHLKGDSVMADTLHIQARTLRRSCLQLHSGRTRLRKIIKALEKDLEDG